MQQTNAKDWTPQPSEESEDSKPTFRVGSLGIVPVPGSEHESYEIGTCGENCNEPNNVVPGEHPFDGIGGKLLRQLINDIENQLAYHEQQAEYHDQQAQLLKKRLEELKRIPEALKDIHHKE